MLQRSANSKQRSSQTTTYKDISEEAWYGLLFYFIFCKIYALMSLWFVMKKGGVAAADGGTLLRALPFSLMTNDSVTVRHLHW